MKEARYFYVPNARNAGELPADEATHALRVLRLKPGDEMFLMDGEGGIFRAEVLVLTNIVATTLLKSGPNRKTGLHTSIWRLHQRR